MQCYTAPTATFNGLLAALMEVSNSYRVLSIRQISPADGTPPEEFLSEVERRYRLPKAWQRMTPPAPGRRRGLPGRSREVETQKPERRPRP